jgi:hypothetical protein
MRTVGIDLAGDPWPQATAGTAELRLRTTDRWVYEHLGVRPLSVSADRIGVAAMRWARIEHRLRAERVDVDRSGLAGAVAETYPAGALRVWGFGSTGYKRATGRAVLACLVGEVTAACGPVGVAARLALDGCSDDQFDAFVCALLARAVSQGRTTAPGAEHVEVARREGWIHLPTCEPARLC